MDELIGYVIIYFCTHNLKKDVNWNSHIVSSILFIYTKCKVTFFNFHFFISDFLKKKYF